MKCLDPKKEEPATETISAKKKISEVLAIAGMAVLLTYLVDAAIGQGETGFLPITEKERGMIFGESSIILFFAAFGIGYKQKSKLTTILIIVGGLLIWTSVLGVSVMAEGGLAEISSTFAAVIIAGFIIMILGIVRAFQRK